MLALREHYSGEGNASRRIATAKRMREGLHYKNERSLAFSIFLARMQKMFNIYEEEGEEFTENAKLRELFKRVQHPQLQDTVKALKVRFDMEGITYTQAANHLTARRRIILLPRSRSSQNTFSLARFQLRHPEHQGFGAVGAAIIIVILRRKGERKPQAKAYSTGYYPNWSELSKEDKQRVLDSRSKKRKGGIGN